MKRFEYAKPTAVSDALSLLSENWGEVEVLAGGTDLVTCLKQNITQPDRLVSLRGIQDLKRITATSDAVDVGAMATLRAVSENPSVIKHFPSLVQAVRGIGSSQMINQGTIGGDLCQRPRCWYFRNGYGLLALRDGKSLVPDGDNRYHAVFGNGGPAYFVSASSLGPALIALGATVTVHGTDGGSRTIKVADLFTTPVQEGRREISLKPNEILTSVHIPVRGLKNATYEIRHRHGLDWPYATASVAFETDGVGKAANASVVLGQVAPTPWISVPAVRALNGSTIDEEMARRCGEAATTGATPLSRNGYKLAMVKTAVKRAILDAGGH